MTQRELSNLDHFHQHCMAAYRRPEVERRWVVARHCAIKFAWAASLLTLFAFLTLISHLAA